LAASNHVVTGAKAELKATLHVDVMVVDPPDLHVPLAHVNGHSRKTSLVTAAKKPSSGLAIHEERARDEMEAEANRVFKSSRRDEHHPMLLRTRKRTVKNTLRKETRFATSQRGNYRNTSKTSGVS
jgi:hypothetical protein